MDSRRTFLKTGLLGAGAMALGAPRLLAAEGKRPQRFIFIHKGNGLLPSAMVPPSLGEKDAAARHMINLAAGDRPLGRHPGPRGVRSTLRTPVRAKHLRCSG